MDNLYTWLADLNGNLSMLFEQIEKGEDVEQTLRRIKPLIRLYYETHTEEPATEEEIKNILFHNAPLVV